MSIFQFTGLSGAGKSTLAVAVSEVLDANKHEVEIIDGDTYRQIICKDLGFSRTDRIENIKRLGFIGNVLSKHNITVIIAAINPFEEARSELKIKYNAYTIYVKCDLNELIKRDTKGLYKRAMLPDGNPEKLYNLTGINDDFEIPENPDLEIDTSVLSIKESIQMIVSFIQEKNAFRINM